MRFDVVVPRRDVLVADRPVDGDAVFRVRLEVEVAPAVALTPPQQRAAADVIAAIPIEALHLGVGRVLIGCPPIEILLIQRVVAFQYGIRLLHRLRPAAAVRVLPRCLLRVHIVFDVLDVLTALEQQDAEAFFGELFGSPASGDSGANDNRVVRGTLHRFLRVTSCERALAAPYACSSLALAASLFGVARAVRALLLLTAHQPSIGVARAVRALLLLTSHQTVH